MNIKQQLYNLLENQESKSGRKLLFDILLAIIIITSITLIFLENEKGELSPFLNTLNNTIQVFFIIEFSLRLYVSTHFRKDIKTKGLGYALVQKLKWFCKINTIIDLLAILPSIEFFRIFRTLRFIRFFRILKLHRSIKAFREFDKILTVLRGMKEESRIFFIFSIFTLFFVVIISFALYLFEGDYQDGEFSSFKDSIWYSVKVIGFGSDTPKTLMGKVFSALLLLVNMTVFSFFVSLVLNKIRNVMDSIASGKIGKLKLENHIVICGYTRGAQIVIDDLLKDKKNVNNIVLVTEKNIPDNLNGVIYVNGDFTDVKTLEEINISKAKNAIVFSESKPHDTERDVDLRTVITIFHIEKINPDVHTIAEINNEENAEIIKEKIKGDEILYKEKIDSKIITNCLKHQNISTMLYELLGEDDDGRMRETTLEELGIKNATMVKEVKLWCMEKEVTFLGFIDQDGKTYLSPRNNTPLNSSHRIIYIETDY